MVSPPSEAFLVCLDVDRRAIRPTGAGSSREIYTFVQTDLMICDVGARGPEIARQGSSSAAVRATLQGYHGESLAYFR